MKRLEPDRLVGWRQHPDRRPEYLNMRLARREKDELQGFADNEGLSLSDAGRQLICEGLAVRGYEVDEQ